MKVFMHHFFTCTVQSAVDGIARFYHKAGEIVCLKNYSVVPVLRTRTKIILVVAIFI